MEYMKRELHHENGAEILELYRTNPQYFVYCPPEPSLESVKSDMTALPPGCTRDQKHFNGYYINDRLCAVLDLITDYPVKGNAFIGLFMVRGDMHKRGFGTAVINALMKDLKAQGYESVSLGYVKTNRPAEDFWKKNRFIPTGIEKETGRYTVCMAVRRLI